MSKVLNIINGDIVLNNMRVQGLEGYFLPWGDFLYSGSVPESLSLDELSLIRAKFIASCGLGEFNEVFSEFKERNSTLYSFKKYSKIFLWFESDIYDQLQLIQVLDWFAKFSSRKTKIYIIYPENYLALSTAKELNHFLLYNREIVTHNHFITARKAWSSFSSKTPTALYKLLYDDIDSLPFLKNTIKRVLEEYPNSINGLSRTEHQILLSISNGKKLSQDIFDDCQKFEERPFMGELIFLNIIKELIESNLLNLLDSGLKLTSLGDEILNGKKNYFDYKKIDRWIGGVHITNITPWRWDIKSQKIIKC